MHEQGVDAHVDDEAGAADEPEADELQPVGGLAQSVQQTHVRPRRNGPGDVACVDVYGGGLVGHRCRLAEPGLAPAGLGGLGLDLVLKPPACQGSGRAPWQSPLALHE